MSPVPVTPQTPSIDWASSGVNQLSGHLGTSGSGAYTGPWRVETQSLYIHYVRVPRAGLTTTANLSLSGDTTRTTGTGSTYLLCHIYANVRVKKSYEVFETSGYQQNQTFKIMAVSADAYGNTYGNLNANGNTIALGPKGSVVTDKEYYNRRLWASSVDDGAEFNKTYHAATFVVGRSEDDLDCYSHFNYGEFEANARGPRWDHSWQNDGDTYVVGAHNIGLIWGDYSTSEESDINTVNIVNNIGKSISGEINQNFLKPCPDDWNDAEPSITEYKASRHDWS